MLCTLSSKYKENTKCQNTEIYYNVTLRSVRVIFLATKVLKSTHSECVCNLNYQISNAQGQYHFISALSILAIFSNYLIKGTIFRRALMNVKYVFWSSLKLRIKINPRRTVGDIIINVYRPSHKEPLLLSDFIEH